MNEPATNPEQVAKAVRRALVPDTIDTDGYVYEPPATNPDAALMGVVTVEYEVATPFGTETNVKCTEHGFVGYDEGEADAHVATNPNCWADHCGGKGCTNLTCACNHERDHGKTAEDELSWADKLANASARAAGVPEPVAVFAPSVSEVRAGTADTSGDLRREIAHAFTDSGRAFAIDDDETEAITTQAAARIAATVAEAALAARTADWGDNHCLARFATGDDASALRHAIVECETRSAARDAEVRQLREQVGRYRAEADRARVVEGGAP